jgi:hypothetical protein
MLNGIMYITKRFRKRGREKQNERQRDTEGNIHAKREKERGDRCCWIVK